MKLQWFKNENIFSLNISSKRIISLDYIQNNTRISILKFSHAFTNDSGVYSCNATDTTSKIDNYQLGDQLELQIISSIN